MPDDALRTIRTADPAGPTSPAERARRLADLDDAPGAGRRSVPGHASTATAPSPSSAPSSASCAPGVETEVRGAGRRAHPAAPPPGQAHASPPCRDQSRQPCSCSCPASELGEERTTRSTRLDLGDWVGRRRHGDDHPQGRAVGEGRRLRSCSPRRCARCPTSGTASSDVDTRYRQRYVDLIVNEDARRVFAVRFAAVAAIRQRRSPTRGFVEVETPVLDARARRRDRATVRHPPQRARHRPLPAHRARAAPEAAGRRRVRAGVRDRAGLPQRGHRHQPQPRVHDARGVPGVRRLPRHDGAHRAPRRRPRRARRSTATPCSSMRRASVDLAEPWPRATMVELIREHAGVDIHPSMAVDDARVRCSTGSGSSYKDEWGAGRLTHEVYDELVEPKLIRPDVRARPPARDVAAGARAPRRSRRWSSGSRWSSTATSSRTRTASSTTRSTSARGSRPRRAPRAAGDRRGGHRRRGLPPRARVRPAAHRRARPRHRPARDAARRGHQHPRGDPLPDAAPRPDPHFAFWRRY